MKKNDLPKGLTVNADGSVLVTMTAYGSDQKIRRTFANTADALEAWARATRVRNDRGDRAAIAAALNGGDQMRRSATPSPDLPVRTVGELAMTFLDERFRLMQSSDHSRRRSRKTGVNSFRPRSYVILESTLRLHVLPTFGSTPANEVTREQVVDWLTAMAERGLSIGVAGKAQIYLYKLFRLARVHERPEGCPWEDVYPIPPKASLRPQRDPKKWGGAPGSKPPALPIEDCFDFFEAIPAGPRCALIMERLAGLRFGEAAGVELRDLHYDADGVLWIEVWHQVSDRGVVLEYLKSDASRRSIPVAPALATYLDDYCLFYHDYDLHFPEPAKWGRHVVVNSAGRSLDGGFLRLRPTLLYAQIDRARRLFGLTPDELGYTIGNHYQRDCFATELLNATALLGDLRRAAISEAPEDPIERAEYLEDLLARPASVEYEPMHVSSYLGHLHDRATESSAAAAVTLKHYNFHPMTQSPMLAIAQTMEQFIAAGVGGVEFEPSEQDLFPVHQLDDPDWCTTKEAAAELKVYDTTVQAMVRDGRLRGHMGWRADGGYERNATGGKETLPSLPMIFVSRVSLKEMLRVQALFPSKTAGKYLGMTINTARQVLQRAGYQDEAGRWSEDAVRGTAAQLHSLVLDKLGSDFVSLAELKRQIDLSSPPILPDRKVLRGWLKAWCEDLTKERLVEMKGDDLVRLRAG